MRRTFVSFAIGIVALGGCLRDPASGLPATELRADPSVLLLPVGKSQSVTVTATLNNELEDVRWSIGVVGAGLTVVEDSSFGLVYQGNALALPERTSQRRFVVTLTGTNPTSFVVSGDAGVVTVGVTPETP